MGEVPTSNLQSPIPNIQLTKISDQATYDRVLCAAREMAQLWAGADLQYCPGFAPWVNQERWQDEAQAGPARSSAGMSAEDIERAAEEMRERGY